MLKRMNRKGIRVKKHYRIRKKILGTKDCPRLAIYRSNNHIYAQIIDDIDQKTIISASSLEKNFVGSSGNKKTAKKVGLSLAKKAATKRIKKVVFDRGGLIYHGRVAALADGAREGGLEF